jgi:hypothetical protein
MGQHVQTTVKTVIHCLPVTLLKHACTLRQHRPKRGWQQLAHPTQITVSAGAKLTLSPLLSTQLRLHTSIPGFVVNTCNFLKGLSHCNKGAIGGVDAV